MGKRYYDKNLHIWRTKGVPLSRDLYNQYIKPVPRKYFSAKYQYVPKKKRGWKYYGRKGLKFARSAVRVAGGLYDIASMFM